MAADAPIAHPKEFLTALVRTALGRAPERTAPAPGSEGERAAPRAEPPAAEPVTEQEAAGFDPDLVGTLAEKVLLAWLRNRHQLLFPITVDLHRLGRAEAELLIHAMIAAAEADGALEGKEQERITGALSLVDAAEDEHGFLQAALARPKPLNEVLREVHDVYTAALVYAASLMAIDQRKPVNRFYLRYLAARLQLSEELVGSLEQRFRSWG